MSENLIFARNKVFEQFFEAKNMSKKMSNLKRAIFFEIAPLKKSLSCKDQCSAIMLSSSLSLAMMTLSPGL